MWDYSLALGFRLTAARRYTSVSFRRSSRQPLEYLFDIIIISSFTVDICNRNQYLVSVGSASGRLQKFLKDFSRLIIEANPSETVAHTVCRLEIISRDETVFPGLWNYFGWQRPCYLLGEGYAKTFKELMEETDWDAYGTGNYEKCANCMVHSGYEASAVMDSVRHPLKAAKVALGGIRTDGEMAAEISLDRQRSAKYVFSRHVEEAMTQLGGTDESSQRPSRAN
jgi:hypothetical protein